MISFTVAIPTFNRQATVVMAVQSVLRQSYPALEVIVLCDGCTDGTADALRALGDERVEVLELDKGVGYAYAHRNVALERARGDVITWLADDDLFLPDHLWRLAARWEVGDVDLVTTPAIVVAPDDALGWIGRDWSVPQFRAWVEQENTNVMASVSARVELLRAIGGWDATVPSAADWDLWKRALNAGARPAMLDEPTVLHFKATGRSQAWPLRVRQNAAWLARLADPAQLASLRTTLRRTRAELEGVLWAELQRVQAHLVELDRHVAENHTHYGALQAAHAAQTAALAATAAELEAVGADRETLRGALAQAQRTAAEHQALAARHETTLVRIYDGGWWRLRDVLRPVLAPAGVLRRRVRAALQR